MIANIRMGRDFLNCSFSSRCWELDGITEQPERDELGNSSIIEEPSGSSLFGVCEYGEGPKKKAKAPKTRTKTEPTRRRRRRRTQGGR